MSPMDMTNTPRTIDALGRDVDAPASAVSVEDARAAWQAACEHYRRADELADRTADDDARELAYYLERVCMALARQLAEAERA